MYYTKLPIAKNERWLKKAGEPAKRLGPPAIRFSTLPTDNALARTIIGSRYEPPYVPVTIFWEGLHVYLSD